MKQDVKKPLKKLFAIKPIVKKTKSKKSGIDNFCIGKFIVARTYSAGVHLGILRERRGTEAILEDSRRLHGWDGAFTLSAVAMDGVELTSRLSCSLPEVLLTEVVEVIPASKKAIDIFNSIPDHHI